MCDICVSKALERAIKNYSKARLERDIEYIRNCPERDDLLDAIQRASVNEEHRAEFVKEKLMRARMLLRNY